MFALEQAKVAEALAIAFKREAEVFGPDGAPDRAQYLAECIVAEVISRGPKGVRLWADFFSATREEYRSEVHERAARHMEIPPYAEIVNHAEKPR